MEAENIARKLLIKHLRPQVYASFVERIKSSQQTMDYYMEQCDMEMTRLEKMEEFDIETFLMFMRFIIDCEFDIEFYIRKSERTIVCFERFMRKQEAWKSRELFSIYAEKLEKISKKSFHEHLAIYSKELRSSVFVRRHDGA